MSETFPPQVFNHDIVWLYDLTSRFYYEVMKSQSAPVSGMIVPDQARLESYIKTLRSAISWIQAVPLLDLPETHPRPYTLEPFPEEINVENESINVIMRLLRASSVELVNSQSARFSSRLQPFDEARFQAVLSKIETFLNDFIRKDNNVPLDLPESSPEEKVGTDGLTGVTGPSK